MKYPVFSISLFLITTTLNAQIVERIEVFGKLSVSNDMEGVTVFNTSSNKGTVTDSQGEFTIKVALNDVLEISALQYEAKTVIVNQDVLSSKQMRLFLVDKVNTLNEVVLLPSKLSGNLLVDIVNAKVERQMDINFGDLSQIEFPEDEFTKVDNKILKQNQLKNGLNIASVLGLNKLINRPIKKHTIPEEEVKLEEVLATKYPSTFYQINYKIPVHQVEIFLRFLVSNGLTNNLLQEDKELILLEFIQKQSLKFLTQEHEKK
ncbi:carboxypeptidase-like regulatory domain-containing protein [Xanthomarina sp. F2636L]|uniref:carboxypeptidase-like regulatory domain-containing protein n=1 Tax=Xanthomarina sp. F2636L TaxID=2996018 RepID=UPI00225E23FC|nr:carboxypeptidase-like regulatory domain-containing protein [Xanthomarina sp. F2636L]MCX7550784.1 carboxypeptidase-like regulatory domain-containing protein [Xanthomarina sp. F2636L]